MARGIDVQQVSLIINYDLPRDRENYIHRIGRTGRAKKMGEAFTLTVDEDALLVRKIERVLGYKLEQRKLKDFNYAEKSSAPIRSNALKQKLGEALNRRPHQHSRRAASSFLTETRDSFTNK